MANLRSYIATIVDTTTNALVGLFNAQEGQLPSTVNNSMRQFAADVKTFANELPWYDIGHTPTRTGNTTFTIPTDVTAIYTAGRRLKLTDSTTLYATVVSAVFGAVTTITVVVDGGTALSASLSAVAYSIEGDGNVSAPADFDRRSYATTAGTSTAYTLTLSPPLHALTNGVRVSMKLHTTCGAAPTLAVNGTAATTIVRAAAAAVVANDYAADTVLDLTYDSTLTRWVIEGLAPAAAAGGPYTIKTATYTAVAGDKILADCTLGAWTLTLPASPSNVDAPIVVKKVGAFTLTIGLNGKNIRLSSGAVTSTDPTVIGTPGGDFTFVYRGTDAGGQTNVWNY